MDDRISNLIDNIDAISSDDDAGRLRMSPKQSSLISNLSPRCYDPHMTFANKQDISDYIDEVARPQSELFNKKHGYDRVQGHCLWLMTPFLDNLSEDDKNSLETCPRKDGYRIFAKIYKKNPNTYEAMELAMNFDVPREKLVTLSDKKVKAVLHQSYAMWDKDGAFRDSHPIVWSRGKYFTASTDFPTTPSPAKAPRRDNKSRKVITEEESDEDIDDADADDTTPIAKAAGKKRTPHKPKKLSL
eukprot:jgi/Tetstr1/461042/TSEL_006192.t1